MQKIVFKATPDIMQLIGTTKDYSPSVTYSIGYKY